VRPLWNGDGVGAPDTVSGRAGENWGLEDAAETVFWSNAPQMDLGEGDS
jgi:hypothetical protein